MILLFNLMIFPWLTELQIKEVDYGTFMSMTEEGNIGLVQISESENQITFTDKEQTQVYKTGMVDDPGRTERLHAAGADFRGEIIEQPSMSGLYTYCPYGIRRVGRRACQYRE